MIVDRAVFARRLRAARELSGLDQKELGRLAQETHRLGAHDVGRIERREEAPAITLKHVQAYALHTGLPEAWFTEERLDQLFVREPEDVGLRVAALEEALERLAVLALGNAEAIEYLGSLPSSRRSEGPSRGGES